LWRGKGLGKNAAGHTYDDNKQDKSSHATSAGIPKTEFSIRSPLETQLTGLGRGRSARVCCPRDFNPVDG
jgi:hypothetical protein